MGKYTPSGRVIIGGTEFQTDAPIVNFREGPRWDATIPTCIPTETDPAPPCAGGVPYQTLAPGFTMRFQPRRALREKWNNGLHAPYDAAKQVIRKFMIHHDGCSSADMCFSVLQNERGLSCHFLIDNDGTIFQTLDLALEGWHGSELNADSIGVELCNRGDAVKFAGYYDKKRMKRRVKPCKINNHVINSFDFTSAEDVRGMPGEQGGQYDAMTRLGRALLRLLPNLPAEYPQSSPGQQALITLPLQDMYRFSGYLGHYHLSSNKWDPGPWDFKAFCEGIRGAFCWPAWPQGQAVKDKNGQVPAQPVVAADKSTLTHEADLLYAFNEARADGGYFPVGPWGESRLWHGGIHMVAAEGSKVFAPFPGRLVAARTGASSPIGSVNFALVRHAMSLGERKLEFYSLYMHLSDKPAEWLAKARTGKDGKPRDLKPGETWLLDEPIEAGAVIGYVGTAGPGDLSKPQLHLELFSISDVFEGMLNVPWETIDGTSGGRFCDAQRINDVIDTNSDKILSRDELKAFYSGGAGTATHYMVTRHVSEWTADPSWSDALRLPKDFHHIKPEALDALVAEQITPGLWWTEDVARHAKLPIDGVVFHYHPVSFVRWLNEKLIDAAAQAAPGFDASKAQGVPDGVTDDREGAGMKSLDTAAEDTCNDKITLKELLQGFDTPECTP